MERLGHILALTRDLAPPSSHPSAPLALHEWRQALGWRIASRAEPVRLQRGVLYVRAVSAAWAQELSLLSEDLLTRLRQRGLVVQSLRFFVGRLEGDLARTQPTPPLPAIRLALPVELRGAVEGVADPELRAAVADAASLWLGRHPGG